MTTNSLRQPIDEPLPNWKPASHPAREPLIGNYCRVEPLSVAPAIFDNGRQRESLSSLPAPLLFQRG